MPARSLGFIYGAPESFKSFFLVSLAASIATGRDFFGRKVRLPGMVVVVAGEGRANLSLRLAAWAKHHQVDPATIPLYASDCSLALGDGSSAETLAEAVEALEAEAGLCRLIAFDTVARNLAGDENVAKDAGAMIRDAERLRDRLGCAVIGIHHTGLGEDAKRRMRGSSAFRGGADFEYLVERDANDLTRVTCAKFKDGRHPDPLAFRLQDVPLGIYDEEGNEIASGVVVPEAYTEKRSADARVRGKLELEALEAWDAAYARHRATLAAQGRDPDGAKVSVEAWRAACREAGIDRRRISDIQERLVAKGELVIEAGGYLERLAA